MNVTAAIANKTNSSCIGPIEVEEGRDRRVQLSLATPEAVVITDLAAQRHVVDINRLRRFFAEQSHLIVPGG